MPNEIKPYELVNIYKESRHSLISSVLFSLLGLKLAIAGFAFTFSDTPFRWQLSLGCWIGGGALALQAREATKQADKYQRRKDSLEWASEEAQISAIVKSVQPSLPGIQLAEPERPLILPGGSSPLESFATVVQQLLAKDLDVRTDYVNAIAGPQLIQLQLRPHDLRKIKQLQGDAMSDSIQTLLSLTDAPIVTIDRGAIALSIPRPDRQFCHFTDYIQPASSGALRMAIGVNVRGELVEEELSGERLQHFVVGGAPRQGKSQWILSAIGSLVHRYTPQQIRFVCGDGKGGVTLGFLQGSPYLLQPVAYTRKDATDLVEHLKELVSDRYALFRPVNAQTIDDYIASTGEVMPYVGVFWDEFQDLFTLDAHHKELPILESLASLAPAAGVFFVWSSQRIDGKLLPPQINSKCLSRVCLKVQKDKDSEFVLNGDAAGVSLLGRGDLLYDDGKDTHRLQGLLIPHRDVVFGKSTQAIAAAPTLEQFSQEFQVIDPRESLERLFKMSPSDTSERKQESQSKQPDIDWDDIPDHLHDLIKYSLKYGWVTARKVKQNVRLYSGSSTDEIRGFFLAAMNAGVGMTRGEGDRLQYAAILGETRDGC